MTKCRMLLYVNKELVRLDRADIDRITFYREENVT